MVGDHMGILGAVVLFFLPPSPPSFPFPFAAESPLGDGGCAGAGGSPPVFFFPSPHTERGRAEAGSTDQGQRRGGGAAGAVDGEGRPKDAPATGSGRGPYVEVSTKLETWRTAPPPFQCCRIDLDSRNVVSAAVGRDVASRADSRQRGPLPHPPPRLLMLATNKRVRWSGGGATLSFG